MNNNLKNTHLIEDIIYLIIKQILQNLRENNNSLAIKNANFLLAYLDVAKKENKTKRDISDAHELLGTAYFNQKNFEKALFHLTIAIEFLNDIKEEIYLLRAQAYEALNDSTKAIIDYNFIISNCPNKDNNPYYQDALSLKEKCEKKLAEAIFYNQATEIFLQEIPIILVQATKLLDENLEKITKYQIESQKILENMNSLFKKKSTPLLLNKASKLKLSIDESLKNLNSYSEKLKKIKQTFDTDLSNKNHLIKNIHNKIIDIKTKIPIQFSAAKKAFTALEVLNTATPDKEEKKQDSAAILKSLNNPTKPKYVQTSKHIAIKRAEKKKLQAKLKKLNNKTIHKSEKSSVKKHKTKKAVKKSNNKEQKNIEKPSQKIVIKNKIITQNNKENSKTETAIEEKQIVPQTQKKENTVANLPLIQKNNITLFKNSNLKFHNEFTSLEINDLPVYSLNLEFTLPSSFSDWIKLTLQKYDIPINDKLFIGEAHLTLVNLGPSLHTLAQNPYRMQCFNTAISLLLQSTSLQNLKLQNLTMFNNDKGFIAIEFEQNKNLELLVRNLINVVRYDFGIPYFPKYKDFIPHILIGKTTQLFDYFPEINSQFIHRYRGKIFNPTQFVISQRYGDYACSYIEKKLILYYNILQQKFSLNRPAPPHLNENTINQLLTYTLWVKPTFLWPQLFLTQTQSDQNLTSEEKRITEYTFGK